MLKQITYFGKQKLDLKVIENLMGLHKNYFNHMFERYREGHVKSYFE